MNIPTPFNQKQIDYINKTFKSWFNVAEGGKRGSKNVVNSYAYWAILEVHPNKLHLIAGVSLATAKLNIIDCDGFGLTNYFEGRFREGKYKNKDCIYLNTAIGEKIILVTGGAKSGDEKYIKGMTFGTAYVTEANECHKDFLKEVFDRTLSSKDRKIFHDLNPKSSKHWYYTEMLDFHENKQVDNPEYGYNYGHFNIADNSSINDKNLRIILDTYDKGSLWYRRDILGLRQNAEGLIYRIFAEDNNRYIVDDISNYKFSGVFVGVDFGHNPKNSANVFVATGITYKFKEVVILEEKYITEELDPDKLNRLFKEFIQGINFKYGSCHVYADNAEGMLVKGLANTAMKNRLIAKVKPCIKHKIVDRISLVASLFATDRLKLHKSCKSLTSAFSEAVWDDKKHDDTRLDDGTSNIDSLDAFEYSLCSIMKELEIASHL